MQSIPASYPRGFGGAGIWSGRASTTRLSGSVDRPFRPHRRVNPLRQRLGWPQPDCLPEASESEPGAAQHAGGRRAILPPCDGFALPRLAQAGCGTLVVPCDWKYRRGPRSGARIFPHLRVRACIAGPDPTPPTSPRLAHGRCMAVSDISDP